jgi:cytochrome b561
MDSPKRYHPVLVTLHWLVAVLVFTDLLIGYFYIRPLILRGGGVQGTDPWLVIHMAAGIAILVLLVVRFIIRLASKRPAPATAGSTLLNVFARLVHYALYFFVFVMVVLGLVFALQTNRFQTAFLGASGGPGSGGRGFNPPPGGFPRPGPGTPFPGGGIPGGPGAPGFRGNGTRRSLDALGGPFPLLALHLFVSILLIALIFFHIGAAFYHQFILKDHLIGRMWYGPA